MQGVNATSPIELPWNRTCDLQEKEDSFHQQIELKCREETNEPLHLEHSFL
jgi:hypothetical protein